MIPEDRCQRCTAKLDGKVFIVDGDRVCAVCAGHEPIPHVLRPKSRKIVE